MSDSYSEETKYSGAIINGFFMLFIMFILFIGAIGLAVMAENSANPGMYIAFAVLIFITDFICLFGFTTLQPNQCAVMIFFGKYRGTVYNNGFFWYNPFCSCRKVSLRLRNMDIDPIKVNDKIGNPVLIGMVLVWKVQDTYKCFFDIESSGNYLSNAALTDFVRIQSDAALREVTGHYAYDNDTSSENELTLRSGGTEINERLEAKINERVSMAGIEVVEARINYLAYAPEIAAVMLRRQQASAIISAREKIVEGAVSMVKMALDRLSEEEIVDLDEERKATMVSNLLVVLCADEPAQPVVNTGTLTR